MNRPVNPHSSIEIATKAAASFSTQMLATKFYVPVARGTLISRPRLNALLDKSLTHPFTLVSTPAGFGKTTLLSTWAQSLQARGPRLCWVSLDEEDNEPRLFWSYVLSALQRQCPERFQPLLMHLQSQPTLPLKSLLTALINVVAEGTDHFVLILDDYQVITEEQVHTTLTYLIEHLPAQLHLILSTRADPPLPLPLLRAYKQALEVCTDQLRCTAEEVKAFFSEVMGIQMPEETIQQVTLRTEGWLVGLHLLGLSLPKRFDPLTLSQELSGDQRYILDYLTQEVLGRQSQEVQTFLLSTCILGRLTASLCEAVRQQDGSQQMLARLEQANLFVVSLDNNRQWYRYHALFAEALRYQLALRHADLVPILHHRASIWYAEHDQMTEAILHALSAQEWQWAADLIERKGQQLMALSWGASNHALVQLRQWMEQMPTDIIGSRPRLCLAYVQMLCLITSYPILNGWFDTAETKLTALLGTGVHADASQPMLTRHEQENLLGEVITWRALVGSFVDDGQMTLVRCQQALSLLSAKNTLAHAQVAWAQHLASYVSSVNDVVAAIREGLQAFSLAQKAGVPSLVIGIMGSTAQHMIGAGRLHETYELTQQAMLLSGQLEGLALPEVGYPAAQQAEILREWNQLDAAHSLVQKAISLSQQTASIASFPYIYLGYTILLRVALSYGELETARSVLQQIEDISTSVNEPFSLHIQSFTATIDQVRLWLASGELDRATSWAEQLMRGERQGTAFAREREEVACARIFLAASQPALALQQLDPVLQRAMAGQRWGHVIEIRLLQALAHQMLQEEVQALDALSEAVRLAEPEGYIRSFVDEGASMEALLYHLRRSNRKHEPTPYLDRLLAAFQLETKIHAQPEEPAQTHQLPEPLSQREREVLQLLASGASNQEIAQELVIALDTVKRHVSHIFAKLGVSNRVQAVRQTRELGLLDEEV